MEKSNLTQDIERIRGEIAAEYNEKGHVPPRAFIFSQSTAPVRIDPNFALPVDESKAEFVKAIQRAAKRLNADAVLMVSETWLAKLATVSAIAEHGPRASQHPSAVEAVIATLSERGGPNPATTLWIAPIERPDGADPFLKEWIESRPLAVTGVLSNCLSTNGDLN